MYEFHYSPIACICAKKQKQKRQEKKKRRHERKRNKNQLIQQPRSTRISYCVNFVTIAITVLKKIIKIAVFATYVLMTDLETTL